MQSSLQEPSVHMETTAMPQQHADQGSQPQSQMVDRPSAGSPEAAESGHDATHGDTLAWDAPGAEHTHLVQQRLDPVQETKPVLAQEPDSGQQVGSAVVIPQPARAAPSPAPGAAEGGDWMAWPSSEAGASQSMYASATPQYDAAHGDARRPDGAATPSPPVTSQGMQSDTAPHDTPDTGARLDAHGDPPHSQLQAPGGDQSGAVAAAAQGSQAPAANAHAPGMPGQPHGTAAAQMSPEGPIMGIGTSPAGPGMRSAKRARPTGSVSGQPPPSRITRSTVHGTQRGPQPPGHTLRRNGPHISDGTAATILVALQSGSNPPQRPPPRRQSRTTADDVPPFTSAEAAADARSNIAGERDALFLALRRHVPNAANSLKLSPQSVTHHVLKVVCTLQVHDMYLTKEGADETVTQLNVPVPATRGPAVELPTFRLACGNREGMMLVTMLSCYVNAGMHPKDSMKTQAALP